MNKFKFGWCIMDIITIVSIVFAFICMILGFTLEGGAINALLQHTACYYRNRRDYWSCWNFN